MYTRETIDAKLRSGGCGFFLPESEFPSCQDLDGLGAHLFLQGLGYTMWGHRNIGTNGVAYTACGLILSTNGYVYRDFTLADKYRAWRG